MVNSLAYFLMMLRKQFTDYCNQRMHELGLSQGQLFFILYVGKHPGCSPKELALNLHMDTGHVTRSLVKLEQAGFLSQKSNIKDRRSRLLCLTEKGNEAFRISHEVFYDWDCQAMACLGQEERKLLLELLADIANQGEGEVNV